MMTDTNLNLQFKVIYQDEYLRVEVDKNQHFIYMNWLKHTEGEKFRELYQKIADITIEYKIEYWLSDGRAIHYISFSDQNWIIQNIAPLITSTNLKKIARLTTKEGVTLMDITRVYSSIENHPDIKVSTQLEVFISKEAAIEWLFDDLT